MRVPFLGSLPFDPEVVRAGDAGKPLVAQGRGTAFTKGLDDIVGTLVQRLGLGGNGKR
jgi:hypothetical protein